MEKELLFYPRRSAGGMVVPVSFYPDHALRYITPETYAAMTEGFLDWCRSLGGITVLCFHPGLYAGSFQPYLHRKREGEWTVTLEELSQWWNRRHQAILDRRKNVQSNQHEQAAVATEFTDYRDRLERLTRATGSVPWQMAEPTVRAQVLPTTGDNAIVIDNTLRAAWGEVHAAIPSSSQGLNVWPRKMVWRMRESGLAIDAKNGFHGCFYGNLGLKAELKRNGALALTIPFVAANELLVIRQQRTGLRSQLRRTSARLRRLISHGLRTTRHGISERVAH
jgi:hypothetical protein